MSDAVEDKNWSPAGRGSPRYNSPGRGYQRGHNYGGGFSPRFANQGHWQQRSPYPRQQNVPFCSTPINYNQRTPYRQHRPNFGGGGGGGRFHENRNEQQGIDAWVSPAMWEDPWKEFTEPGSQGMAQGDNSEAEYYADDDTEQGSISTTQFATDLSITSSENNTSSENMTCASSVLDVSDMIMKSAMESGMEGENDEDKPLPDISMEDLLQPTKTVPTITPSDNVDKDKTDDDDMLETQEAKDLLSLITS